MITSRDIRHRSVELSEVARTVNSLVNISRVNYVASGPKFSKFLLSNVGGIVVDNAVCGLSIALSVLKIFAIKV